MICQAPRGVDGMKRWALTVVAGRWTLASKGDGHANRSGTAEATLRRRSALDRRDCGEAGMRGHDDSSSTTPSEDRCHKRVKAVKFLAPLGCAPTRSVGRPRVGWVYADRASDRKR